MIVPDSLGKQLTTQAMNRQALVLLLSTVAVLETDAGIEIQISEVAGDLNFVVSGSIDLTPWMNKMDAGNGNVDGYEHTMNGDRVFIKSKTTEGDTYEMVADMTIAGTLPTVTFNDVTDNTDPGAEVGFNDFGGGAKLIVPDDYMSNDAINLVMTMPDRTFADLGVVAGQTWSATWAVGAGTESFKVTAVPEPSGMILGCTLLLGLLGRHRPSGRTVRL